MLVDFSPLQHSIPAGYPWPEMQCKVKNSEHFTSISSLILFVFTCKGVHMTDFMEKSGNCQRDKSKLDGASYVYIFNSHSCYSCMHCMRESMESNSWKFVMGISLSKTPMKLAKPLHNMPPLQELKIQHSTHFSFQNKPWQETFSVNTCACMWK